MTNNFALIISRWRRKMPDDAKPWVISVPEAGKRYFNLGRWASYEAAKRGDIPTIRVGNALRVPVRVMEKILSEPKPAARGHKNSPAVA
jgi:hypothetical protein